MFKEGYLKKHDYENWQTMTSKYHGIENSSKKLVEINKPFREIISAFMLGSGYQLSAPNTKY